MEDRDAVVDDVKDLFEVMGVPDLFISMGSV